MKKLFFLIALFTSNFVSGQSVNLPSEKFWAERISAEKYVLKQVGKKATKIYQGLTVSSIDFKTKPLILKDSLIVNVEPNQRLFFAIKSKKDTLIFSERRLWFDQSPNFRDLGGLKTNDGKTTKWNKLFRCGDMGQLSEQDLTQISNLKITSVVDFRNERELKQSPDKYPENINRVWTSISSNEGSSMKKFYELTTNKNATENDAKQVFESFYVAFPDNIKNYKPFFDELLANKNGLLFHCTAGKDRTGFGSALLLLALGVSEEDVVAEYYLSNRYTKKALQSTANMRNMKPEVASVLAGVEPQYIKATLNACKAKYGSVLAMLNAELVIDDEKIKVLKKLYCD